MFGNPAPDWESIASSSGRTCILGMDLPCGRFSSSPALWNHWTLPPTASTIWPTRSLFLIAAKFKICTTFSCSMICCPLQIVHSRLLPAANATSLILAYQHPPPNSRHFTNKHRQIGWCGNLCLIWVNMSIHLLYVCWHVRSCSERYWFKSNKDLSQNPGANRGRCSAADGSLPTFTTSSSMLHFASTSCHCMHQLLLKMLLCDASRLAILS